MKLKAETLIFSLYSSLHHPGLRMTVSFSLLHEIKGILQVQHNSAEIREFPSNVTQQGNTTVV